MSTYLQSLKKKTSIDRISQLMDDQNKGKFQKEDEGFWELTTDEAGTGEAVIRFLPQPEGEDYPFVMLWYYSFKGPNGWYINESRTNISPDEKDPMRELNFERKNSGLDSQKELAKKQCAKKRYISNIYVVRDPKNPQNEGKVFLFRYGKKIFDKLMIAAKPEFAGDKPISPFSPWEGADFKLRCRKVDGERNYDMSVFAEQSEFLGGDEKKLDEVLSQMKSLKAFLDPSRFKSYDELKKRLDFVMKAPTASSGTSEQVAAPSQRSVASRVLEREVEAPVRSSATMERPEPVSLDLDDDAELEAELAKFRTLSKKS